MIPTDLSYNDRGLLLTVTDFNHLIRWTGAQWEFAPGDRQGGYIQDFVVEPQESGWVLCNGTSTSYLVVSPSPAEVSITLPDEVTNPVYHSSIATYTGTVVAPAAPTLSGSTGTPSATTEVQIGVGATVASSSHTHPTGTLAVSATGEPRHLGCLRYFRR